LEDFLLFSPTTYWRLFALENQELWPLHLATLLAGGALLWSICKRLHIPGRWIGPVAATVWIWVGWRFVLERYGPINWAADYLGWLYFLQAAILALLGFTGKLHFARSQDAGTAWAAYAIVIIALAAYPLLALAEGRSWETAEVFGIAPDPTVVATLGLLALTPRTLLMATLQVIPALLLIASALTLIAMDAWQGWVTLALWAAGVGAWAVPSDRTRQAL
jgi:hypothetical protein